MSGALLEKEGQVDKTRPQTQRAQSLVGEIPNVVVVAWLEGESRVLPEAQKRGPSPSPAVDWRASWGTLCSNREGGVGWLDDSGVWKWWELGRVDWSPQGDGRWAPAPALRVCPWQPCCQASVLWTSPVIPTHNWWVLKMAVQDLRKLSGTLNLDFKYTLLPWLRLGRPLRAKFL